MKEKICRECQEPKPLNEYYYSKSNSDHKRGECIKCFLLLQKARRMDTAEKRKQILNEDKPKKEDMINIKALREEINRCTIKDQEKLDNMINYLGSLKARKQQLKEIDNLLDNCYRIADPSLASGNY